MIDRFRIAAQSALRSIRPARDVHAQSVIFDASGHHGSNFGVNIPKVALSLLILCVSAGLAAAHPNSESRSGIKGTITISPIRPGPIKKDRLSSGPLAKATFVVQKQASIEIASFTTDAEGRFEVFLPPGHYRVSRKNGKSGPGFFGPFDIDVTAGKMTTVEWRCDSGMR